VVRVPGQVLAPELVPGQARVQLVPALLVQEPPVRALRQVRALPVQPLLVALVVHWA
jgi:hypothetical protein